MSLPHAEHNEAVCEHLAASKYWNDWVLTTAFYAALHFVESRIFPLKRGEREYRSLDEYYPSRTDNSKDKHQCRENLVWERLRKAHSAYAWLRKECYVARYNNYQTSDALAAEARKKLAVVKSLCVSASKPEPTKAS